MMNNRIMKIIGNTVGIAAVAALGITVYQLGTSPEKEETKEERTMQPEDGNSASDTKQAELESMDGEAAQVETGTKQVEADLENSGADLTGDSVDMETEELKEETKDAGGETANDRTYEAQDVSAAAYNLPEINFSEETLMEWPVNGNILVDYSMDQTTYFPTLDQYKLSPAIAVQAVEGAPVMAAVNGTVYSVEQNAQTGTTVTMELGNGYQAVYGQLTDLAVGEGDTIKKGAIIGYVGAPTKYYSVEGSNLYFAMKKDGEPIDPIAYLP